MKRIYLGVFAVLLTIIMISTFQDLSARQDPGQPCDPDALPGEQFACPLDSDVVFLLVGGVGLYFVANSRGRKFLGGLK
ncbi:hypothetical protein EZJ43_02010 [Pedobacter changchengzhani]|uniref:Uncharacterized protein n=1 Tax=Pedobacter changchengzhani TaxID=2529274 RepID=A0A4R5MR56_9SPHI|nr:hypothetical protein [Pedobacter changchengzhani]TDG37889.1 hypothetical protein EZJ43_02010 [Pedobacter changchengzhani]